MEACQRWEDTVSGKFTVRTGRETRAVAVDGGRQDCCGTAARNEAPGGGCVCVCATGQGAYRLPPLPRSSSRRGGGWRMRADRRRRDEHSVLGAGHLPSHSALLLRNLSRPLPQMGAQHAWAVGGLVRPEDGLACWQAQPHDDARAILMATCGNDAESSPWTESTLLSRSPTRCVCMVVDCCRGTVRTCVRAYVCPNCDAASSAHSLQCVCVWGGGAWWEGEGGPRLPPMYPVSG